MHENAPLLALIKQQENTISQRFLSIEALHHHLQLFRYARFGRSSEKFINSEQLSLQFDEAIAIFDSPELVEEQTETITYTRNKNKTGRKALSKSLPFIEKIHGLAEIDKHCACGCTLTHIDDEVTEQLDVVPQMTFHIVQIRKKYACKGCE